MVRMVLTGQVNRDLVGLINRNGPFAIGMSGEDANLFTASRRCAEVDGEQVDLGLVGEIDTVDPARCSRCSRRPGPGGLERGPRRGRRGLQRQRGHRCGRAGRRAGRGEAGRAHRRGGPVRRLAGRRAEPRRRRDQPAQRDRAGDAAARPQRGHDPEDGGLPARRCAAGCPRRTCSTGGCRIRCCWRSSPTPASAPWSSRIRARHRSGHGTEGKHERDRAPPGALRGGAHAQLRHPAAGAGPRRGLPGLGRRRPRVHRPVRGYRGQLPRPRPSRRSSRR